MSYHVYFTVRVRWVYRIHGARPGLGSRLEDPSRSIYIWGVSRGLYTRLHGPPGAHRLECLSEGLVQRMEKHAEHPQPERAELRPGLPKERAVVGVGLLEVCAAGRPAQPYSAAGGAGAIHVAAPPQALAAATR